MPFDGNAWSLRRLVPTREALAIVNAMDADVFGQFNYTVRTEPFELHE